MAEPRAGGLLRIVPPERVEQASDKGDGEAHSEEYYLKRQLLNQITAEFQSARDFRVTEGIEDLLLSALRAQRGEYSPEKLQQIQQFSGSQVYARITAAKCRGATAILKDIYLNSEEPWVLAPTPKPVLPEDAAEAVIQLVQSEVAHLEAAGQPVDETAFQERIRGLMEAAQKAALQQAVDETARAERYLKDQLVEGQFYEALGEFLIDLPLFPYACIKGPTVRKKTQISYVDGKPTLAETLRLFWQRVSPFDLWFTPGANGILHSAVMERIPLTRDELYDLKGTPDYDDEAIDRALAEFEGQTEQWSKWSSNFEQQRRDLEKRGSSYHYGDAHFVDTLEYHGYMRGQWLLDWGKSESEVSDPLKEYYVTAWVCCDELLKVQINPNPRQRPIYYVTSYEKVPGTLLGHGLPQILGDIQEVANATLRALVNNLSIASGPQVEVNTERMAPNADVQSLYPWKRWFTKSDPFASNNNQQPAVSFWQPQSNAHELLNVYKEFTNMADEISAIPRYMSGSPRAGGAASTASGLAMLMDNSSKVMQSVLSNIDREVLRPLVEELYDMVMLLHPEELRGDENIVVKGVANALKREQDRVRQLEFLQITANPIDVNIIGPDRRAAILRAVAQNIGLPHEDIVPTREEIRQAMETQPPPEEQPGAPDAPAPSEGGAPHLNTQDNARST